MQKPKYVTNKELLSEIHRSKNSFCKFTSPEHAQFDAIVHSLDQITPELLAKVQARRYKDAAAPGPVVIRVMTSEHIPLDPERKRKPRGVDVIHARTNFPPFKHYLLAPGQEPVEVGRSHWRGDFETGAFALDHGKMSNRLAEMFMLLVERYSRRGNWRGYCVDEETEALTQRGWLSHEQITTDDVILSFKDGRLAWSSIESIFKDRYDGKMFHLTARGLDALITPGHKMVTQDGLKRVEYLLEKDRIILTGKPVEGAAAPIHSDAFVEIVGWVVTEGSIYQSKDRNYPRIGIYQNEGVYADRIRGCLETLGSAFSEYHREGTSNVRFDLTKDLCSKIASVIDTADKALNLDFILSLTERQRDLLINTMIDADGWRTHGRADLRRYCQKSKKHIDSFVFLCTLAGLRAAIKTRDIVAYSKPTTIHTVNLFSGRANHSNVENIDFHGGKRNGKIKGRGKINHPNEPTVPYSGIVWCPKTEFGCFVARRNGTIYLTGNTYNDEMRSHALLQLAQIGLQFDESKSDNPFAFYTTAIRNSFTRVLNLERKNQHIRDEVLIMSGSLPSYNRQIEHEIEMRALETGVAPPAPPKRKKIIPKKSSNQDLFD